MKKLFIETYGCQMNVADSEVVASVMQMAGYEICEKEEEADAIFLNTCSIRENAENKIYHRLDTLHAEQKKGRKVILGVLGCMAERVKDDLIQNHYANLVCGPDSYLNLPDMIAQCEMGTNAINIELSKTETYRDIVPQRIGGNRVSGFVSIMRGCNNFCHYCIVPYTRGRERSRDAESILREVRDLQQRGFKEVTLLGQNVNSYGLSPSGKREEGSLSFAELLHMVAQAVPDMRVRFTTSNPEDMTEDILHAIAEEPNLCKHIHFPAQSGSNKILKLMNRKYTREEYLQRIADIKAFCAEEKMNKRFNEVNSSYRDNIMRVNIRQQMAHPMSEFLGTILIVVVLWFGGILVLDYGRIDGPTIIFYLVMLYSIINPLKEFSKASYNIPKGLASMERIDKILQAEVEIKDKETPEHISSFEHQIEFRHVSFAYTDRKSAELVYVLKDINLVIPKGKTVALVGQSGSGKSTMVDLIPRYYDVQEGEVLIDGINVKDLAVHDLRMLIGNVNQEAILFNASFKDNIRFGKTDATDEEIANAAKIANAYEFITKSEHGFDTNIGDRGGRLSGGQRQRVSIARAILKNPPILILDEATSALDTESERLVQDALEKLMKTRTTVAVAHRLSTIKHADEICVLHEGKIVERGTHDELIRKDGYYKKLHDMQQV
jgi:MiaB/RimO family radical SAM methylthiotransferase